MISIDAYFYYYPTMSENTGLSVLNRYFWNDAIISETYNPISIVVQSSSVIGELFQKFRFSGFYRSYEIIPKNLISFLKPKFYISVKF